MAFGIHLMNNGVGHNYGVWSSSHDQRCTAHSIYNSRVWSSTHERWYATRRVTFVLTSRTMVSTLWRLLSISRTTRWHGHVTLALLFIHYDIDMWRLLSVSWTMLPIVTLSLLFINYAINYDINMRRLLSILWTMTSIVTLSLIFINHDIDMWRLLSIFMNYGMDCDGFSPFHQLCYVPTCGVCCPFYELWYRLWIFLSFS